MTKQISLKTTNLSANGSRKLTNGKTKTGGIYNRDWFKKIENGFYKYSVIGDEIEIWLAFEGHHKLNKTDPHHTNFKTSTSSEIL